MTASGSEKSALKMAAALVHQKLVACASVIPGIKSYYHFEGSAHLDNEVKLLIKTKADLFGEVSKLIADMHPYKVPEILMFRADAASMPYLEWMEGWVRERE
jgi:periplasmic divalent cation tolerance protein